MIPVPMWFFIILVAIFLVGCLYEMIVVKPKQRRAQRDRKSDF